MMATPSQPQPAAAPSAVRATSAAPRGWIASLHLAVLTTFAVTQPAYDRLSERPAFLADSGLEFSDFLLLIAIFSIFIPALVAGLVIGTGRLVPRLRDPLYGVAVFGLLVVTALPIVKRIRFLAGWQVILAALGLAAAATWCYFAFRRCRSLVTVAATAIAVFPAVFLFSAPVRALFAEPLAVPTGRGKPVPIVFLVFDEFRGTALENERRKIDADRFPNFAALAGGSTWYRNATTVSPDTRVAVPALLSGKFPTQDYVTPVELPQNVFSVLEAAGSCESAVFEPVSRLSRRRNESMTAVSKKPVVARIRAILPTVGRVILFHLAPDDLHEHLPPIPRLWFGLRDSEAIDRGLRRGLFRYNWGEDRNAQFNHFLDCLDDPQQPVLYFQHILLPHVPWCYLPSGRCYLRESNRFELLNFDTHSDLIDFWGTDDLFVTQSQQRQLLQLEYVDQLIGRLLAKLHDIGLYDKCLLIVTADHGICFQTGECRRAATPGNLGDILSIPLFVKFPGQQVGAVSDRFVQTLDIFPTIADVLGIRTSLPVDGRSLLDSAGPERKEVRYFASGQPFSVPLAVLESTRSVGELHSRFGEALDPEALYRIGPNPELVGMALAELPVSKRQPVEIELLRSGTFYNSDPQSVVPCYFEGRVASTTGWVQPVAIAVAVNGKIHAVTRTYQLDGIRDRWSAMVPEAAFHEGENDVQYFAIESDGPNLRLSPCIAKPGS